jgi:hypothetical protein
MYLNKRVQELKMEIAAAVFLLVVLTVQLKKKKIFAVILDVYRNESVKKSYIYRKAVLVKMMSLTAFRNHLKKGGSY